MQLFFGCVAFIYVCTYIHAYKNAKGISRLNVCVYVRTLSEHTIILHFLFRYLGLHLTTKDRYEGCGVHVCVEMYVCTHVRTYILPI